MTKHYEENKRWRKRHPEARYASKERYYAKTKDAPNKGARYTEGEKELIMAHIMTDPELAEKIGRSVKSIQTYRAKLKKEWLGE